MDCSLVGSTADFEMRRILIAGQQQSGSTLLFNAIRHALELSGHKVAVGEFSAWGQAEPGSIELYKTHPFDAEASEADIVFTTLRDPRDCMVSHITRQKLAGHGVGPWTPFLYGASNLLNYKGWEQRSDYEFRYELYKEDPVGSLRRVCRIIGCEGLEKEAARYVANDLVTQSLPQTDDPDNPVYRRTLLSRSHLSGGGKMRKFESFFDATELARLNFCFMRFLRDKQYLRELGYGSDDQINPELSSYYGLYAHSVVMHYYASDRYAEDVLRAAFARLAHDFQPFGEMDDHHRRLVGRSIWDAISPLRLVAE
jgi:hypothetical protein